MQNQPHSTYYQPSRHGSSFPNSVGGNKNVPATGQAYTPQVYSFPGAPYTSVYGANDNFVMPAAVMFQNQQHGMSPVNAIQTVQQMLPTGQQVITMTNPQQPQRMMSYDQRNRNMRYQNAQPPANNFNVAPQQQSYYSSPPVFVPNPTTPMMGQPPPSTTNNTRRERKALAIVDPRTGNPVTLNSEAPSFVPVNHSANETPNASTSSTEVTSTPSASIPTNNTAIAAQFAAQVAATLNPTAPKLSNDLTKDPVKTQENTSEAITTTQDGVSANKIETKNAEDSSKKEDIKANSDLAQEKLVVPKLESSPTVVEPVTNAKSEVAVQESKQETVESSKVVADLGSSQAEAAEVQVKPEVKENSADAHSGESKDDLGNRKKNKKQKQKELNSKGKVLQGSDMDAFIDEAAAPKSSTEAGISEVECNHKGDSLEKEEKKPAEVENVVTEITPVDKSESSPVNTLTSSPLAEPVVDNVGKPVRDTNDFKAGSDSLPQEARVQERTKNADIPVGSAAVPDDLSKVEEVDRAENITNESTNSNPEISTESTNDLSLPPPTPETFQHEQSSESLSHKAETKNNDSVMLKIKTGGSSISDVESKDPTSPNIQNSTPLANSKNVTDSIPSELVRAVDKSTPNDNCLTSNSKARAKLPKNDPKYTYAEEQWSPLNPEGKKQYDRSFLLQCQNSDLSVVKPAGLPPLDIVLREPRVMKQDLSSQPGGDQTPPVDFTPGFIIPSMPGGRGPSRGGRPGSAVKRQNSEQSQQRKIIDIKLPQDITLHTAEKAWKPVKQDELDENEIVYKKVRSILNKLTPQKFQTLIQQVRTLPINTQERLTGCINIIFEKAISEPNFSVAYANMAKCLISLNVPSEDDPTVLISFRKLLLTKCQLEFEKDKIDELDIAKIQQLIDAASTEEIKKQLVVEKNDLMWRAKRRSLGNIRFIGELFKLKMLTEKIMHECLKKLLKSDDDEDSLECLCQLLTTIGSDIDQNQSKQYVNQYFAQLERMVALKNSSHRIRFMIQDIIDLRKNDWVPRREKNNPKTIEQIHREAEKEEQDKQMMLKNVVIDKSANRRNQGRNTAPTTPVGGAGLSEDGWTAVSRPPKVVVDPSKMRFSKPMQVDDNIQLGPGGRGMSVWHRGSSGGSGMKAPQENDNRGGLTPNRFSALGNSSGSESMDARNMAPRAGGGNRDREYRGRMSGPHTTRGLESRPSQERGEMSSRSGFSAASELPDVRLPMMSRSASHEVSRLVDVPTPRKELPELSEEEIEKKTKALVEEYLQINDIKEATECVVEIQSPQSIHLFVYHSLIQNLERSVQARQHVGILHQHLIKSKVLTLDQYVKGLRMILEVADDMVIDIPRIWEYVAELICPLVVDGPISLRFLRQACEPLLVCDKAGILVAQVLLQLAHRLGHHRVAELWQDSRLKWSDFVKPDAIPGFLIQHKLEFTEAQTSSSVTPPNLSAEEIHDNLVNLFAESDTEVEKVLDWIDENADESMRRSSAFVRALMTSLCISCTQKQKENIYTVDQPRFKKFIPVLKNFTAHKADTQLDALFALQGLVHRLEHPSGLLRTFFEILYDEEAVGEDVFYKWKHSADNIELGKGVALQSVVQFFNWLENDEES